MNEKSQIRRRRLKFAYFASTGAAVLVFLVWVCSYFVGVMIFGSVRPAREPTTSGAIPAASSAEPLEAPFQALLAGGLLLFETAQVSSTPLPHIVPIPVGEFLTGKVGIVPLARSLIPGKSPMGTGTWIPLWIPLVICAIPAVACRRKLGIVRAPRVRRTGVTRTLRFAVIVGSFVIATFLTGYAVECVLGTALVNDDVVSGMRQAWGVSEEGALLVLICASVFIGAALAFAVDYLLMWKRVIYTSIEDRPAIQ